MEQPTSDNQLRTELRVYPAKYQQPLTSTLFILNDAPYGSERACNALRPEGYYNVELMLGKIVRRGEVLLCGTCVDARAAG